MSSAAILGWTSKATEACERARASGLAFNLQTNKLFTVEDMVQLGEDYEKVRNNVLVDKFLEDKLKAVPFSFVK